MKIVKDNKVVFSGTLKECVEELTDGTEIMQEVNRFLKQKGYCEVSIGAEEYIIVK